jgi:hypothetical protein
MRMVSIDELNLVSFRDCLLIFLSKLPLGSDAYLHVAIQLNASRAPMPLPVAHN